LFDKAAGKGRGGNDRNTNNHKSGNKGRNQKKKGAKSKKGDTRFLKLERKLNAIAKQRTKKLTPAERTAKYKDTVCHTCKNKGHIKKHCPEAKETS